MNTPTQEQSLAGPSSTTAPTQQQQPILPPADVPGIEVLWPVRVHSIEKIRKPKFLAALRQITGNNNVNSEFDKLLANALFVINSMVASYQQVHNTNSSSFIPWNELPDIIQNLAIEQLEAMNDQVNIRGAQDHWMANYLLNDQNIEIRWEQESEGQVNIPFMDAFDELEQIFQQEIHQGPDVFAIAEYEFEHVNVGEGPAEPLDQENAPQPVADTPASSDVPSYVPPSPELPTYLPSPAAQASPVQPAAVTEEEHLSSPIAQATASTQEEEEKHAQSPVGQEHQEEVVQASSPVAQVISQEVVSQGSPVVQQGSSQEEQAIIHGAQSITQEGSSQEEQAKSSIVQAIVEEPITEGQTPVASPQVVTPEYHPPATGSPTMTIRSPEKRKAEHVEDVGDDNDAGPSEKKKKH